MYFIVSVLFVHFILAVFRFSLVLFLVLCRRTSRKTQDLWWRGIPPSIRGKVWKLAIGNDLNVTAGQRLKNAFCDSCFVFVVNSVHPQSPMCCCSATDV